MIDKMYQMFMDSIPDYKGKICVPLSGGLDSRVLAGLISRKRKIDLSYCQYLLKYPIKIGKQIENVSYARKIAEACGVERFETVCVNYVKDEDLKAVRGVAHEDQLNRSGMYTGLRILNERIDLSEYTMISAHGLDTLTGIHVNPPGLFNYRGKEKRDRKKMVDYFTSIFPATYGAFGEYDCPLWGDELNEWCFNLPVHYRFHQKLYRQMIKKYFPELAVIPREDMHVSMDIGEIRYFYERFKFWLRK